MLNTDVPLIFIRGFGRFAYEDVYVSEVYFVAAFTVGDITLGYYNLTP